MRRLLIRPGAIGDCIVSLPALKALRTQYTEVWVAAQNVPLIRFADCVRSISSTGVDLLEIRWPDAELRSLVEALRSFDSIVSWYGAGRQDFRDLVRHLDLPFQFFPALPLGGSIHAVDYYLAQAATIAGTKAEPKPKIECSFKARSSVVIHPFSGSAAKNWPLENYQRLARSLQADAAADVAIEWCAGPSETLPEAHRFTDLYELACWLAGARLFIGNDSGITHLAAAARTPVVAIFGPTDPAVWAPRGEAVRIVRMSDTMAAVLEAARELLA